MGGSPDECTFQDAAQKMRGKVYEKCNVYYERQRGYECALHAVNCVLHSTKQHIISPEDMDKADGHAHGGNWGDHAVKAALKAKKLSCVPVFPGEEKPNATAWIVNDTKDGIRSVHWHSYVKNQDGMWFDVESYGPSRGFPGRPVCIGDERAMMQRLKHERAQSPPRYIFRVAPLGAQQSNDVYSFGGKSKPSGHVKGGWTCKHCKRMNSSGICTGCETPKYLGEMVSNSNSFGVSGQGGYDSELAQLAAALALSSKK